MPRLTIAASCCLALTMVSLAPATSQRPPRRLLGVGRFSGTCTKLIVADVAAGSCGSRLGTAGYTDDTLDLGFHATDDQGREIEVNFIVKDHKKRDDTVEVETIDYIPLNTAGTPFLQQELRRNHRSWSLNV